MPSKQKKMGGEVFRIYIRFPGWGTSEKDCRNQCLSAGKDPTYSIYKRWLLVRSIQCVKSI